MTNEGAVTSAPHGYTGKWTQAGLSWLKLSFNPEYNWELRNAVWTSRGYGQWGSEVDFFDLK